MFKIILILAMMNNLLFSGNFINEQKRYGRVRDAIKEKYNLIENNLKNNNIKAAKFLIERGADLSIINEEDKTALTIAKDIDSKEIIELINIKTN